MQRRQWFGVLGPLLTAASLLSGCAGERPHPPSPDQSPVPTQAIIAQSLPQTLKDRSGWATDLYAGFAFLALAPTRENVCAVVAVIEQESGFRVDPVIPGLPAIAWREIDERAAHVGVPRLLVRSVLQLKSPTGRSYGERIDTARTEKQLSDVYEDFIAAVPLGSTLFAERNPIRTRGPMQVHIVFAEQFAAAKPYPYPVAKSIADEVFTRRGGVYFGIAHLLAYAAPYDDYVYRFADFNAGQYASRNAAFQRALSRASGVRLIADGALLPHDDGGKPAGATELAARNLSARLKIGYADIHRALEGGKSAEFSNTVLYQTVFSLAEQAVGRAPPRAVVPQIELHGPQISRRLTTPWYADRVEERFQRCLNR